MTDDSGVPRRIIKETQRLEAEPISGIKCTVFPNNPRHFAVVLAGPDDTPYQGGIFQLELFLPDGYPMCPPKVRFLTKIYHPNIDRLGRICLDVLKDKWSPALQIRTVLLSIVVLMSNPEPQDPLDTNIADHFLKDRKGADQKARDMTAMYAKAG